MLSKIKVVAGVILSLSMLKFGLVISQSSLFLSASPAKDLLTVPASSVAINQVLDTGVRTGDICNLYG